MAPADVSDTDVFTIWNMRGKAGKTAFRLAKISGGPARAHQQREDEIRERWRTKLRYRDIQSA